jgi:glutamate/tyrosine decarboxylase-like PLP-dependent enzyme
MHRIPESGRDWPSLKAELEDSKSDDYSWRDGRMALYYYFRDDALTRVQQEAYTAFWNENGMAQRAFPSPKRLETEVIEMGMSLLNAPAGAAGTFTSGGSESIFLALKTARDWARAEKGIRAPNFVVPRTAHPTFTRAGHLLGIDVIRVPTTRNDFKADVAALERRIDADTIGLVGSAPNYPFGVFDPIAEIGALAERRGLWMHVDACVGGFLAPFARDLGHDIPPFDFAVPGVTSISADLHKYGYAAKGASLMLLRDKALQDKYQMFTFSDWERGAYASPLTTGTRPAGAVAAAWAVLNHLGLEGYRENARIIMDTKRRMVAGINAIPGLAVLEPHELCLFVYRSVDPTLDIGAVAEALGRRKWFVGRQAEPPGIHIHLNTGHADHVEAYLRDLRAAVDEARGRRAEAKTLERTY